MFVGSRHLAASYEHPVMYLQSLKYTYLAETHLNVVTSVPPEEMSQNSRSEIEHQRLPNQHHTITSNYFHNQMNICVIL